jgi:hypothetical protein
MKSATASRAPLSIVGRARIAVISAHFGRIILASSRCGHSSNIPDYAVASGANVANPIFCLMNLTLACSIGQHQACARSPWPGRHEPATVWVGAVFYSMRDGSLSHIRGSGCYRAIMIFRSCGPTALPRCGIAVGAAWIPLAVLDSYYGPSATQPSLPNNCLI